MKKYYLSMVDLSEINALTANGEHAKELADRLERIGLLKDSKPRMTEIRALCRKETRTFLSKLAVKLAFHKGELESVCAEFQEQRLRGEYTAMFLYLSIWYGYLGWQVPTPVSMLPVSPEAMKVYMEEFSSGFCAFACGEERDDAE